MKTSYAVSPLLKTISLLIAQIFLVQTVLWAAPLTMQRAASARIGQGTTLRKGLTFNQKVSPKGAGRVDEALSSMTNVTTGSSEAPLASMGQRALSKKLEQYYDKTDEFLTAVQRVNKSDINSDGHRQYDFRFVGKFLGKAFGFIYGTIIGYMALNNSTKVSGKKTFILGRDARDIKSDEEDKSTNIPSDIKAGFVAALRNLGITVIDICPEPQDNKSINPNTVLSYNTAFLKYQADPDYTLIGSILLTCSHISVARMVNGIRNYAAGFKVKMFDPAGYMRSMKTPEIKKESLAHVEEVAKEKGAAINKLVRDVNPEKEKGEYIADDTINQLTVNFNTMLGDVAAGGGSLYELDKLIRGGTMKLEAIINIQKQQYPASNVFKGQQIVVDGSNTPAGDLIKQIYENLGANVILINGAVSDVTGEHTRDPGPDENMKDARKVMSETGALFCVKVDADGDRLRIDTFFGDEIVSLGMDNLMLTIGPDLVTKWGYDAVKEEGEEIVFVADALSTPALEEMVEGLKKQGYPVRIVLADSGYTNVEAKVFEEEKKGNIVIMWGEKSGHGWMRVTGLVENPLMPGILIGVKVAQEKFKNGKTKSKAPYAEVFKSATEKYPYTESPRTQPIIFPAELNRVAKKYGITFKDSDQIFTYTPGVNIPQPLIESCRHEMLVAAENDFTRGKKFTVAGKKYTISEIVGGEESSAEDKLERYITIKFTDDQGRVAGQFVVRGSSNDPTYVDGDAGRDRPDSDAPGMSQEREFALAAVKYNWMEVNGFADVLLTERDQYPQPLRNKYVGKDHAREVLTWYRVQEKTGGLIAPEILKNAIKQTIDKQFSTITETMSSQNKQKVRTDIFVDTITGADGVATITLSYQFVSEAEGDKVLDNGTLKVAITTHKTDANKATAQAALASGAKNAKEAMDMAWDFLPTRGFTAQGITEMTLTDKAPITGTINFNCDDARGGTISLIVAIDKNGNCNLASSELVKLVTETFNNIAGKINKNSDVRTPPETIFGYFLTAFDPVAFMQDNGMNITAEKDSLVEENRDILKRDDQGNVRMTLNVDDDNAIARFTAFLKNSQLDKARSLSTNELFIKALNAMDFTRSPGLKDDLFVKALLDNTPTDNFFQEVYRKKITEMLDSLSPAIQALPATPQEALRDIAYNFEKNNKSLDELVQMMISTVNVLDFKTKLTTLVEDPGEMNKIFNQKMEKPDGLLFEAGKRDKPIRETYVNNLSSATGAFVLLINKLVQVGIPIDTILGALDRSLDQDILKQLFTTTEQVSIHRITQLKNFNLINSDDLDRLVLNPPFLQMENYVDILVFAFPDMSRDNLHRLFRAAVMDSNEIKKLLPLSSVYRSPGRTAEKPEDFNWTDTTASMEYFFEAFNASIKYMSPSNQKRLLIQKIIDILIKNEFLKSKGTLFSRMKAFTSLPKEAYWPSAVKERYLSTSSSSSTLASLGQLNRSTTFDSMTKEELKNFINQLLNKLKGAHVKARTEKPPIYPERFFVPEEKIDWNTPFDDYRPVSFTAPDVFENDVTKNPKGWADSPDISTINQQELKSYEGEVKCDENGYPVNQHGRTGMKDRGLLGKWGANFAGDAIVMRNNPENSEETEILLILRNDGHWALPGGMRDFGEEAFMTIPRELKEETGLELDNQNWQLVYKGYVDDWRNTDNAWMESLVMWRHIDSQDLSGQVFRPDENETFAYKWAPVDGEEIESLFASHTDFIKLATARAALASKKTLDTAKAQALVAGGILFEATRALEVSFISDDLVLLGRIKENTWGENGSLWDKLLTESSLPTTKFLVTYFDLARDSSGFNAHTSTEFAKATFTMSYLAAKVSRRESNLADFPSLEVVVILDNLLSYNDVKRDIPIIFKDYDKHDEEVRIVFVEDEKIRRYTVQELLKKTATIERPFEIRSTEDHEKLVEHKWDEKKLGVALLDQIIAQPEAYAELVGTDDVGLTVICPENLNQEQEKALKDFKTKIGDTYVNFVSHDLSAEDVKVILFEQRIINGLQSPAMMAPMDELLKKPGLRLKLS